MIAWPLPARTPEEIGRLLRALGSHRYVAGRLLLVHAFVFDAVSGANGANGGDGGEGDPLREGGAWARDVLASAEIDPGSRDERLWRRSTEREVAALLGVLWNDDEAAETARVSLAARLRAIDAPISDGPLFDEAAEDDIFPVLIDAGWELLRLGELDQEKHRGAIEAFGDPLSFDCARFDEESAGEGAAPLQELPALGPAELLRGAAYGILRAPLVLWTHGNEKYQDYVLRGVMRAAKLD
jgi:hypothetical protein